MDQAGWARGQGFSRLASRLRVRKQEKRQSLEYGKCLETGEATKFLKYGRGLSMESVKKRKIPCVMEKRHRHRAPNDLLDV